MLIQELEKCVAGEHLVFSSHKSLYWEKEKTLFLADCHLGKVAHFRQSGIGIPAEAGQQTFADLHQIIKHYQPARVVFLGDLFHSLYNADFDRFSIWASGWKSIDFHLVIGNHDKASGAFLEQMPLAIHQQLQLGPFHCSHYPDFTGEHGFNLAGHLHPAFHFSGKAFQSATCPCFWVGNNFMVLPAFGSFTGFAKIKPKKGQQVIAIAGSRLIELDFSTEREIPKV